MADRYQIKGKLGRGGIGAIYRGYDTQLDREVAIKRLLPLEETHLNEMDNNSLIREASALARFQHPNVVTIFAFEEDDEGPFVVTELIRGENLKATVEKGALGVADFQEFVSQTLDAMIAAQQMDLLHRDIKPANLMLLFLPSGKFQVKILDFGLAKFSEAPSAQTLDQKGSFLGSIDYIAPEQIERKPLDQRTDLYSLGCVCYFALTQQPPFEGESLAKTMDNHLKHRVTSIFDYRPDLPPAIGEWVMRMIARKPSQRPLNATVANAEFEQAKMGILPQTPEDAEEAGASEPVIEATPAPAITPATGAVFPDTGSQPLSSSLPSSATGANAAPSSGGRRIVTGPSAPIKTTTKADLSHLNQTTRPRPTQQFSQPIKKGLPVGAVAGIAATVILLLCVILFFVFKGDNPKLPISKAPAGREVKTTNGGKKPNDAGKSNPPSNKGTAGAGNQAGSKIASLPVFSPPNVSGGKSVKVYILLGEANMLGQGQITGDGSRWGNEFIDPVLSVYKEPYQPGVDFDKLEPVKTVKLKSFGGVKPDPYPGGGTQIVRGQIAMKATGVYHFRPGWAQSIHNIMEVDGREVHRKEPDKLVKSTPIPLTQGVRVPFKITYLTDAADALGWTARTDVQGSLYSLVNENKEFPSLMDGSGNWMVRKDVWHQSLITAKSSQWLSVGCGAQKSQIGPELGFGKIVGDYHDDPVLILKFAQAGRSLGWDFLPPESKSFELKGKVYAGYRDGEKSWDKGKNPKASDAYAGKAYDESFRSVVKTLENFDRSFPAFKGSKYEIAGFVWWQGHSDTKPPYADRYEQNLVNLIKSLRKDFKAPEAPFVIGTIGIGGWKMEPAFKKIADAQLAVSNDNDNVLTVETRDYWKPANLSPKNLPHFYNNHAGTVMNVGQALGEGMVELLKKSEK